MKSNRWQKIEEIFHDALELEPGERRAAFLLKACAGNHELRREVESLLEADKPNAQFLEEPPFEISGVKHNGRETGAKIGETFGQYKFVSLVGAGGMGEVYRARDTVLQRDVAIKILSASISGSDGDRLRRFEQEARSLGQLNHPNILAIYGVGSHDDAPYVVSELLEGETLRERLNETRISPRKALDFARQIARGLAAAHEKAIVHRDLKPENLFITTGGHIKILDFGLAKLTKKIETDGEAATLQQNNTESGMVLGTAGYMSPEQVRGGSVDSRSDIFAFGAVLYEMLAGKKAFQGESLFDVMNQIVKEEPPDLTETNSNVSPALAAIVRRCLEKNPAERFQSASDLAFALESLAVSTGENSGGKAFAGTIEIKSEKTKSGLFALSPNGSKISLASAILLGLSLLSAIAFSSFYYGKQTAEKPLPAFKQITFRNGSVWRAQFAPDEQTILYLAAWDGKPFDIYSSRLGSPESRSLGFEVSKNDLLSVSATGEILFISGATLVRAQMAGGGARELLENVAYADWSPDGASFAVVRRTGTRNRLEFPAGRVLYETDGTIYNPAVSPKNDRVAFYEIPFRRDNTPSLRQQTWAGVLTTVDLAGNKQILSSGWATAFGMAWHPSGEEIWFTAAEKGNSQSLYAVTLDGKQRTLLTTPAPVVIHDVSSDGRVLLSQHNWRWGLMSLTAGESVERDLSWFDVSSISDVSRDGKTILFNEVGAAYDKELPAYLRKTDGSPAVLLGKGDAIALSPDGKSAILIQPKENAPAQITLMPTGAGEPRQLTDDTINHTDARWFADGKRILFLGNEPNRPARLYVQDLNGENPRAITPEGVGRIGEISPDGKFVAAPAPDKKLALYPVDGGEARVVPGAVDNERIIGWSADARSLYVLRQRELPAQVFRLDIETGRAELWKELAPADPTGVARVPRIVIAPDGKSYAYSYYRNLSQLYLVEGLK